MAAELRLFRFQVAEVTAVVITAIEDVLSAGNVYHCGMSGRNDFAYAFEYPSRHRVGSSRSWHSYRLSYGH